MREMPVRSKILIQNTETVEVTGNSRCLMFTSQLVLILALMSRTD